MRLSRGFGTLNTWNKFCRIFHLGWSRVLVRPEPDQLAVPGEIFGFRCPARWWSRRRGGGISLYLTVDVFTVRSRGSGAPGSARFGPSVAVLLVLLDGGGGVVVQSLRHQLQRQPVLEAARLLDLRAFVLEPDLDLRLVQVELLGQNLAPLLRDVPVRLELGLQPLQLLGREGRARPLVLFAAFGLLDFPCPWTCSKNQTNHDRT